MARIVNRIKNEAASRLHEYLSGIREIKTPTIWGGKRFERMRRSFDELKSASIGLEGIMGPTIEKKARRMNIWPSMMRNLQSGNKSWRRLYMVNPLP
ncbi:hypothetical protein MKY85_16395 [Paenibacillus sp. FSL R5-0749]|uniref:hypothetical protein n=1 Tax=Paenibacillus sp. FSL R5-0749 TaxID=2921657 RepID=UPI00315B2C55